MKWFLQLMEELGIECQVGHPATIRAAEPRRQKHDQRDAELLLKLLVENRFPSIWQPSQELLDLRGCSCTVISGYACARGYRTPCRPSRRVANPSTSREPTPLIFWVPACGRQARSFAPLVHAKGRG